MVYDYDYIIIGAGMAGLQLANAFLDDSHFKSKSILIIEPHQKIQLRKLGVSGKRGLEFGIVLFIKNGIKLNLLVIKKTPF